MDPLRTNSAAASLSLWQDGTDSAGIPLRMICPISRELMLDPVVASDGYTYDAPMLRQLLQQQPWAVSPMTRERLAPQSLPNGTLQREIGAMLEAHPRLGPSLSVQQQDAIEAAVERGVARHAAKATVCASALPDDSSVDAYFAAGLQSLVPGRTLRHTSPWMESSLRRFVLLDSPWAPALASAAQLARRSRLPVPQRPRDLGPVQRRSFGIGPSTTRPPFTSGNWGWLEPLELDRLLSAIHDDADDAAELLRPLLQHERDADTNPNVPSQFASPTAAFEAAHTSASDDRPNLLRLAPPRAHSAPSPAWTSEPAPRIPTPPAEDDESGWDPMDWMPDEPPV